jgi:hypothetical protein
MMDRVQELSNLECYTSSSKFFNIDWSETLETVLVNGATVREGESYFSKD